MKTFTVAVAVAVVLTIVYFQESSALPAKEGYDLMEGVADGSLVAVEGEMPADSWKYAYQVRQTRGARQRGCRFCCNCCPGMSGCGLCCRF
ncbi:hepcidin-like isoform 1-T1 [Xenentodon cancila]